MGNWRDHKAKARADIHRTFEVPAVYLTHTAGDPVPCHVRVHSKVAVNENEFTFPSSPGYLELDPAIIFDKTEVPAPLAKAIVVVGPQEMYRLGTAEPYRERFSKCDMTSLTESECAALITALGNIEGVPEWDGVLN